MAKKRRAAPVRPRDPFWRLRRLLGHKRRPGKKAYRRTETRKVEREARDESE